MAVQASLTIEQRLQAGLAAHQRGDFAAAEALYLQILAVDAAHFDALHLLGVVRLNQKRHFDALELIGAALKIQPKDARALSNFGMALTAFGRTEEALDSYNKAIALQPDFPEALNNRGLIFYNRKEFNKALNNFDKALAVRPDHPEALFNRGNVLFDMRRLEEAIATYRKALAVTPSRAPILNNLGNAQFELNRFDQALDAYGKALELRPDYADAFNNRGRAFYRIKRYDEALADFGNALAFAPTHVEALNNRGNALRDLRRYQEAIGDFERALALAPEHPHAFGGLADSALKICDWPRMEKIGRDMPARIEKGDIVPPLTALGYTSDPRLQLECSRAYVRHLVPSVSASLAATRGQPARRQTGKLRIAYLSSDYFSHATAFLMAELFEIHDRSQFDILGFCFSRDDRSKMRARLSAAFDEFHLVHTQSDREVAELIRRRKVDIAIDLKGLTQDSRPAILASRPAPVQITYIGFPGPMGADFIDYVIADPIVLPFEQQPFYTEKIVQLPDCYQVNDSRRAIAPTAPTRRDAGLPERGLVFCCFNNNWKITPPLFDVWMRLLRTVEDSVLWLIRDNEAAAANLRRQAAERGINPQRLVFAEHAALEDHLARHALADLFLDTLLYNAHTTASDALWTGLPIVSCLGESFSGRVAASLLHAVGLADLVTTNLTDYEALALRLAQDPSALKAVRERLKTNRNSFPLFDTDRFRRHIESAYTTMWDIYKRGEPPRGFRIEPIPDAPQPSSARQPTNAQKPPALDRPPHLRPQHFGSREQNNQEQPRVAASAVNDQSPQLLLVCGPWGSGTSAVAGLIHRLGVSGLEPYFETRDERTQNSYESVLFRDVMVGLVDEETLSMRNGVEGNVEPELRKFRSRLLVSDEVATAVRAYRPIFLKHPLSAMFLPQICKLFETRLVYVVRPLADIETTRRRRGWASEFGSRGAEIIYSHMFRTLVEHTFPTTIVRYGELLDSPLQHARRLSDFARLGSSQRMIEQAAAFIANRSSDLAGNTIHS
jgi:protein O-GlcNAc transferase